MALVEKVIGLLENQSGLSVREICIALQIEPEREREVYGVLKKAAKVLKRKGKRLLMQPPRCKKCGFEFEKMRATKCPRCRSEWIEEARFFID
ncbi:transcriptional regulator [Archaeoglobus neptunius]|uniref:transcriptional regulator n=1 Tax=Archaeoglobus neptunius TaxID=2798580 RepID=UPI002EDBA53F